MDTADVTPFKRCSRGANCIHPNGPWLPATTEHFYINRCRADGLRSECRYCFMNMVGLEPKSKRLPIPRLAKSRRIRDLEKRRASQRIRSARRDHRKRNLPATLLSSDWRYALDYFDGRCAYCGNGPSLFDIRWLMHKEHHIPVSRGGGFTPGNILPACQGCNFGKSNLDFEEWAAVRFKPAEIKRIRVRLATYFASVRQEIVDITVVKRMTPRERALARRADLPGTRRCSYKEKCVHIDGPVLPLTNEYFAYDKGGLDGFVDECKACTALRMRKYNKTGCVGHVRKLTDDQIDEIRHLYSIGNISQRKLAKMFNVTPPTVRYYVKTE